MTKTNTKYEVGSRGFLLRPDDWDEEYAEMIASEVGIDGGLTAEHWRVIRFVRSAYDKYEGIPSVIVTCVNNKLSLRDLKLLFPAGYHRGVCRLAGVSYRTGYYAFWVGAERPEAVPAETAAVYRVDAQGFLVDHAEWDENYAVNKARELKMSDGLTDEHWKVINYLRESFARTGVLPTVIAACEDNQLELEELAKLFPDGYHRGAVKVAGLRFA